MSTATNQPIKQETLEPIIKLTKDLKEASRILTQTEARFLVDAYYMMQNDRIRSAAQVRAMSKDGEPCSVISYLFDQTGTLEKQISKSLTEYAESDFVGKWSMSVCGIGGVLAAGLLAHIDIAKAPTAGHIWSFGGVNPNIDWKKGEKRPFNAKLKVILWKIGQSFVKVSGNKNDYYGKIYLQRKQFEQRKNEAGEYAAQARSKLVTTKYGKSTEAFKYMSGQYDPEVNNFLKNHTMEPLTHRGIEEFLADEKAFDKLLKKPEPEKIFDFLDAKSKNFNAVEMLSPGHIQQRVERYAMKLFIAHWHEVAYRHHFKTMPPNPYPIAHLGHAHKIEVPNNPFPD